MFRTLAMVAAAVAVALPLTARANPVLPQLGGKVSARSISLTNTSGQRVRTLIQNKCRITVKDSSKTQNFHLVGPGVDLRTKVSATGTRTWTVNFRPGTYVYHSDKNAKLRGSFKVYPGTPA